MSPSDRVVLRRFRVRRMANRVATLPVQLAYGLGLMGVERDEAPWHRRSSPMAGVAASLLPRLSTGVLGARALLLAQGWRRRAGSASRIEGTLWRSPRDNTDLDELTWSAHPDVPGGPSISVPLAEVRRSTLLRYGHRAFLTVESADGLLRFDLAVSGPEAQSLLQRRPAEDPS